MSHTYVTEDYRFHYNSDGSGDLSIHSKGGLAPTKVCFDQLFEFLQKSGVLSELLLMNGGVKVWGSDRHFHTFFNSRAEYTGLLINIESTEESDDEILANKIYDAFPNKMIGDDYFRILEVVKQNNKGKSND